MREREEDILSLYAHVERRKSEKRQYARSERRLARQLSVYQNQLARYRQLKDEICELVGHERSSGVSVDLQRIIDTTVAARYEVSVRPDGEGVDIYFGGIGTPDGPGHGHCSFTLSGEMTYRREPFIARAVV